MHDVAPGVSLAALKDAARTCPIEASAAPVTLATSARVTRCRADGRRNTGKLLLCCSTNDHVYFANQLDALMHYRPHRRRRATLSTQGCLSFKRYARIEPYVINRRRHATQKGNGTEHDVTASRVWARGCRVHARRRHGVSHARRPAAPAGRERTCGWSRSGRAARPP